jgi:hypothetical protein
MRRSAAILATAVAIGIGIVPSVAAAGNGATVQAKVQAKVQLKAQLKAQLKIQAKTQQATVQVVVQRVSPALTAQRVTSHKAQIARFTYLLAAHGF